MTFRIPLILSISAMFAAINTGQVFLVFAAALVAVASLYYLEA